MRSSSALLLAFLALTGCASQHRPYGELTTAPVPRTIIGVEVTNTYGRSIEVFYSTQYLGTLAPSEHKRWPVPPSTERTPIYARMRGYAPDQRFNISSGRTVRYVYEDPAPATR